MAPDGADEPTDYWLSNMDDNTPIEELVRLAKIRWRIEHDYRELKTGLGLDHFEGRSFAGWHRHVTLVVIARAFCILLRLDPKAPAPDDPYQVLHELKPCSPSSSAPAPVLPARHTRPPCRRPHRNLTKYY
jgi:SRSO17 transposase